MIDWLIHSSIHSFIHPLKTKSVSWFAVCSLFICCLHVLYVIWYNLYMRVCVCVCVRACVCNFPFFIFCMLFIYMYISSIWRNKSWNPKKKSLYIYLLVPCIYPPKLCYTQFIAVLYQQHFLYFLPQLPGYYKSFDLYS